VVEAPLEEGRLAVKKSLLGITLVAIGGSGTARAFCGFYVAKADARLFNRATGPRRRLRGSPGSGNHWIRSGEDALSRPRHRIRHRWSGGCIAAAEDTRHVSGTRLSPAP
jgi:hypothetical protein